MAVLEDPQTFRSLPVGTGCWGKAKQMFPPAQSCQAVCQVTLPPGRTTEPGIPTKGSGQAGRKEAQPPMRRLDSGHCQIGPCDSG